MRVRSPLPHIHVGDRDDDCMLQDISQFTLELSTFLFIILALLEYLHRGFVSYFFDIRILLAIILLNIAILFLLAKNQLKR